MPRKALTLFSCTTPRILPEVVLATGPCVEPSLAFAAIALFNAPLRMLLAPSAAPLTKDRRFIFVFILVGDHFTPLRRRGLTAPAIVSRKPRRKPATYRGPRRSPDSAAPRPARRGTIGPARAARGELLAGAGGAGRSKVALRDSRLDRAKPRRRTVERPLVFRPGGASGPGCEPRERSIRADFAGTFRAAGAGTGRGTPLE